MGVWAIWSVFSLHWYQTSFWPFFASLSTSTIQCQKFKKRNNYFLDFLVFLAFLFKIFANFELLGNFEQYDFIFKNRNCSQKFNKYKYACDCNTWTKNYLKTIIQNLENKTSHNSDLVFLGRRRTTRLGWNIFLLKLFSPKRPKK